MPRADSDHRPNPRQPWMLLRLILGSCLAYAAIRHTDASLHLLLDLISILCTLGTYGIAPALIVAPRGRNLGLWLVYGLALPLGLFLLVGLFFPLFPYEAPVPLPVIAMGFRTLPASFRDLLLESLLRTMALTLLMAGTAPLPLLHALCLRSPSSVVPPRFKWLALLLAGHLLLFLWMFLDASGYGSFSDFSDDDSLTVMVMYLFLILLLLLLHLFLHVLVPAGIARIQGRRTWLWGLYGLGGMVLLYQMVPLLAPPLSLIHILSLRDSKSPVPEGTAP